MRNMWRTVLKVRPQNVRLRERMHPEKCELDEIQNGRLSTIILL